MTQYTILLGGGGGGGRRGRLCCILGGVDRCQLLVDPPLVCRVNVVELAFFFFFFFFFGRVAKEAILKFEILLVKF